jgi:CubicO group peptidase (beta-lactamase class C family)
MRAGEVLPAPASAGLRRTAGGWHTAEAVSLRAVSQAELDGLLDGASSQPGGVLAVVLKGELVFAQGCGLADIEQGTANGLDTVFNLASTSKQFTAFLVLMLAEEGVLSLDDEVRAHLPEIHDFGTRLTLRHLLHHTSGLRDTYPDLLLLAGWRFTDTMTQEDCLRLLRNQRELNFEPGTEFVYANANYVLLAEIVGRATGRRFGEVARERIFEPLGMTSTAVRDHIGTIIPRRAMGYYQDDDGGWHDLPVVDAVLGSTNVYSCARDLVHWVRNLATGEVGGSTLIRQMTTPGRLADGSLLRYAGGLEVGDYRGCRVVEHGGQHGGYCSWVLQLPDDGLAVIALHNCYQWAGRQLPIRVVDLYLGTGEPAETAEPAAGAVPIQVSAAALAQKAGTYFSPRQGTVRHLEVRNGKLVYLPYELTLVPVAQDRFVFGGESGSWVEFDETGMQLHADTVIRYERVEQTESEPSDRYAGRYYCPELQTFWWIEVEGNGLVVRRTREALTTLTALFGDTFGDDWAPIVGFPLTYTLAFQRGPDGEVDGFRLFGAGVRGLRFHREG